MSVERPLLAIITARGGSKGLPGKNMRMLCGQPLLHYSIEAAKKSSQVDRVVVTSDDPAILGFAQQSGVVALQRPAHLATDSASSLDVIRHVFETQKDHADFILLQPTSPLRTSAHINESIALYRREKAGSVIGVKEYGPDPFKCFVLGPKNDLQPLVKPDFKPRQELPMTYLCNGAIYVCGRQTFLKQNTLFVETCLPYVMNADISIDIDTLEDLQATEKLMQSNR